MSESIIPKWALERAEALVRDFGSHPGLLVGSIAGALVHERERCAQKADHYTKAKAARRARELTTHEVYEVKIFARLIAAAIRGAN